MPVREVACPHPSRMDLGDHMPARRKFVGYVMLALTALMLALVSLDASALPLLLNL